MYVILEIDLKKKLELIEQAVECGLLEIITLKINIFKDSKLFVWLYIIYYSNFV